MDRRRFLQLSAAALASAALGACQPGIPPAPGGAASPSPSSAAALQPSAAPRTLKNGNTAGFCVRYFDPFPAPDPDLWQLNVLGLVPQPVSLCLSELLDLPQTNKNTRMKCVEGWSSRATWGGVT